MRHIELAEIGRHPGEMSDNVRPTPSYFSPKVPVHLPHLKSSYEPCPLLYLSIFSRKYLLSMCEMVTL